MTLRYDLSEAYTSEDILWTGYCQLVKFGAPIEMQQRMLARWESAQKDPLVKMLLAAERSKIAIIHSALTQNKTS